MKIRAAMTSRKTGSHRTIKNCLLAMKLTTLLTIAFLNLSAAGVTQTVTYSGKETSLKKIFHAVKQQTGYVFFYDAALLRGSTPVTVSADNMNLETFLQKILVNQPLAYTIENRTIVISRKKDLPAVNETADAAPPQDITGTLVDSAGGPIENASVKLTPGNRGTTTNASGEFSLVNVPEGRYTLEISYVGFETLRRSVTVSGSEPLNLGSLRLLKAASPLSEVEVIVIGYGTQRRSNLTSSISRVGTKEINELPVVEVGQALQGRVSGLTVTNVSSPGTAPDIRIRGVSSVSFATDPLYVIDGFPTTNLNNFDNHDVESVEVLKDASAAAIYGSRATNGVILITTKKGSANKRLKARLDSYVGIESPWRQLTQMNTEQRNAFMDALYAGDNASEAPFRPSRYTPEEMNKPAYPGATQTYAQTNTDWEDLYFKTGLMSSNNISLSGGGNSSSFYSSAGYTKQEGIVRGVGFDRYNFRINSSHDLGKRVTFGENLYVSYSDQEYSNADGEQGDQGTPLSILQFSLPHIPLRDPITGNWLKAGGDAVDGHPFPNLIADIENITTHRKTTKILGSAFVDIKLTPWLKFRSTVGVDYADALNTNLNLSYPVYDGAIALKTNDGFSYITNSRSVYTSVLSSNMLSFDQTFGEDHHINAVAVYEAQKANIRAEFITGKQSDPTLRTLNGATDISATNRLEENLLLSYVFRVGYQFRNKYLLNASIRRDGSSVWAPGRKFANFPAISAGWNIARESFMENVRGISELKIRASYGVTGLNPTALSNYPWQSLVYTSVYPFNNVSNVNTAFYNKLNNQNLEWEKTNQFNVGIDAGFLKDALTVSVEYFDRVTDNLILKSPTPPSFGFVQFTDVNIGKMENKGFEFEASYNQRNTEFKWGITGNVSVVRNKVLRLDAPNGVIYGGEGNYFSSWGFAVTRTKAGEPIQSYYGWEFDKIYQTQAEVDADNESAKNTTGNAGAFYQSAATAPGDVRFVDLNNDGVIDDKDRQNIGSFLPDFTYGANFTASYKNFDLSLLFQGVQGGEIFSAIGVYSGGFRWPLGGSLPAREQAWTSAKPSTTSPRIKWSDPNDNSRVSKRWLQDASYLRLKNISIGYEIPAASLERALKGAISKFRIYVASQNLITFTNYDLGYDPEIGAKIGSNRGAGNLTNGIDYGQYPAARSVLVGVQVEF